MHKIRPYILKIRNHHALEAFPTEDTRIAFIHGCMKDIANDPDVMVAFTIEYLRQCGIQPTHELVKRYLIKISSERLITKSIGQLIRKGIVKENESKVTLTMTL